MASEMSDDLSEVGGEAEGMLMSSASSVSYDFASEPPNAMSETEDSNSCLEPSSSETDSYISSGMKTKDDMSNKSSTSDLTQGSTAPEQGDDSPSASKMNIHKFPLRPGIVWRKGERLEAEDYQRHWYSSKIMLIDEEKKSVLIHFEGWNQRYDEWVEMDSERLRPLTRHSERRDKRRRGKTVYRMGDQVLAKWTDCKMYLAKIDEVLADGSYMVLFYDGFKKNIQPINLKPVPEEQKHQKFQIKPPVLSPKDVKNIKSKPVEYKVTDEKHGSVWGQKAEKIKDKLGGAASGEGVPGTSNPAGEKILKTMSGPMMSAQKKSRLIISGSLFSRREKAVAKLQAAKDHRKAKEVTSPEVKVESSEDKVKEGAAEDEGESSMEVEVSGEAVSEVAEEVKPPTAVVQPETAVVAGTEASCQTYIPPAVVKKAPAKRRPRSGSFPGEKRRRRGPKKHKVPAVPGLVKKAKSTDTEKSLESPGLPPPALLPPLPAIPPKAFLVEEDHNSFKCQTCHKGFRKKQLLQDHIKHYHKAADPSPATGPGRKRKKTLSTCSTDSDMSVSSKASSAKRRRHISELSVGSPDLAMKMSFDEESPGLSSVAADFEGLGPAEGEEEATDEVVNCSCLRREEIGTMIQCDCCQCWQHTVCSGFREEDLASEAFLNTYVCLVCKHPAGVRQNARHLYDMDWFRKGKLPTFNFVRGEVGEEREKQILDTHSMLAELLAVQRVMHGLREEIALTGEKDHPELQLWHPKPPKETHSVAVSTADKDDLDPLTSSSGRPSSFHDQAKDVVKEEIETLAAEAVSSENPIASAAIVSASIPKEMAAGAESSAGAAKDAVQPDLCTLTSHVEGGRGDGVKGDSSATPHPAERSVKLEGGLEEEPKPDLHPNNPDPSTQPSTLTSSGVPATLTSSEVTGASETLTEAEKENVTNSEESKSLLAVRDCGKDVGSGRVGERDVGGSRTAGCDSATGHGAGETAAQAEAGRETAPAVVDVKVESMEVGEEQDGEDVSSTHRDPLAESKLAVLGYVRGIQDNLSTQLDTLEQHIAAMERQEFGSEAAGCISNIPVLKHSLYRLARDLNKVKGIATYR